MTTPASMQRHWSGELVQSSWNAGLGLGLDDRQGAGKQRSL